MRIVELIAENFKKIRVVEITPDGKPVIQLTGRNGQGKSSVLDALWFGLKGQKALPNRKSDAVRRGAEKMKVSVKLGNGGNETFTITRTLGVDGNPPTLAIVPAVHKNANKTPQEYLDDLFGALTFDPLAFAGMSTAEQIAELKKTAKVDIDFEKLAEEDEADYNKRHGINQQISLLEGQIKGMQVLEGLPKDKVDTAPIIAKLNQATELNRQAQETFAQKQQIGAAAAQLGFEKGRKHEELARQQETIKQLEDQLARAKAKLKTLEEEHHSLTMRHSAAEKEFHAAPAGEQVDVGALTAELQAAERTNRAIEQRTQYDHLKAQKEAKQRESDQLTRAMEARAEKKRLALSKAKIPVEGLTFDEHEVKFHSIPIGQLGEGEQIRISTLIGMAANPKLRILCIRHGEALDDEGLKTIAQLAKANDFQIWMARVDSSGKCGIVMEDGSIAARNEE
jgi:DNA repair exonuclease SbcCD ATPase subunit